MTMRAIMDLCEARHLPGMLGVKARLHADAAVYDDDALRDWGIMGELWIAEDGGLGLFRAVTLPQPWERHLKRVGHRYWSTDPGGAHSYDADTLTKGTVEVKIAAMLKGTAKVDWDAIWATILQLHHVGEDEVRLDAGTKLTIVGISVDGRPAPQSMWLGKVLTA